MDTKTDVGSRALDAMRKTQDTKIAIGDLADDEKEADMKAVSVGASGGIYECNICGVDMWRSWDCSHWPGEVYVIEKDGKKEEVRCIPILKADEGWVSSP